MEYSLTKLAQIAHSLFSSCYKYFINLDYQVKLDLDKLLDAMRTCYLYAYMWAEPK